MDSPQVSPCLAIRAPGAGPGKQYVKGMYASRPRCMSWLSVQDSQGPQGFPAAERTNATSPPPPLAPPPSAPPLPAAELEPATCGLAEAALALVAAYADQQSRRALFACSKACWLGVLQAAKQFTATLRAYAGMGEARWQRRLHAAEQAFVARGPGRRTRLVLWLPTNNYTAQQSVLGMAEAAGRAVTGLKVLQAPGADFEDSLGTAWLARLPSTFPNLCILRLHPYRRRHAAGGAAAAPHEVIH